MAKYRVYGELDYIQGHLRYGHKELEVDKEEWDGMTEDEQKEYLQECGDTIVDDYEVDGCGNIETITKEEVK